MFTLGLGGTAVVKHSESPKMQISEIKRTESREKSHKQLPPCNAARSQWLQDIRHDSIAWQATLSEGSLSLCLLYMCKRSKYGLWYARPQTAQQCRSRCRRSKCLTRTHINQIHTRQPSTHTRAIITHHFSRPGTATSDYRVAHTCHYHGRAWRCKQT